MRQSICLLLIVLGLGTTALGQPGGTDLAKKPPIELETLVPIGNGFVLIMVNDLERPSTMALRYFDQEETLMGEKDIDLRRQGLLAQFEGAFEFNGDLCVMTSLYYPGPKRNHLLFRRYKLPDLEEVSNEVIDEAYTPTFFRIPFGFAKSPNEEYLSFCSWTYTLPEDPAKVTVRVFNKKLEEVWNQRYLLPFKNETFYIFDHAVNNEGRSFIFCENYQGKPGTNINESKIEYRVLAAEQGNTNLIEYNLNMPDHTITGLRTKMDSSGAIVGAAFIKDPNKKSRLSGLYLFRVPPDGKSIQRSQLGLSEEMYEEAFPYGEKDSFFSGNKHKFSNFAVDYIFEAPDGSWIVVGEYRKELPNSYEIQFNDMLVAKISPDLNKMVWYKRIPKRQTGYQGQWSYLSYKAFHKKDNVFLIFNDTRDNHDQQGGPKSIVTYESERAQVILMQINTKTGEVLKNDLTDMARKRKVEAIWPSRAWEINGKSRVVVYGDAILGNGVVASVMLNFAWGEGLY